jgi:hypothetical protein
MSYPDNWFRTNVTRTEPYTLQEAFDRIWQFFVVDKHPKSLSSNGSTCCYRSEYSACAVGCLLPDDLITPEVNYYAVADLENEIPQVRHLLLGIYASIRYLQHIHDWSADLASMTDMLRNFAQDHHLTVPSTETDGSVTSATYAHQ